MLKRIEIDLETADSKTLALAAIANMQVYKESNKAKLLALCIAIAHIELSKNKGA